MSKLKLNLIVACDAKMGIGLKNDLPWRLRKEMGYFNRMTLGTAKDPASTPTGRNVVLMGRLNYDSIPEKFRPLKDRLNVVLSRSDQVIKEPNKNLVFLKSWEETMNYLSKLKEENSIDDIWVIGGSFIYKLALESPFCHRIYLTRIQQEFDCDVFFPEFDQSKFKLVSDPCVPVEEQQEGSIRYKFEVYERNEE